MARRAKTAVGIISLLGLTVVGAYILRKESPIPNPQNIVEKIETLSTYCPEVANERKYNLFLKQAGTEHDLDWLFAKAILIKESHFQENLISATGAVGPMQLMPREGSYTTENYSSYVRARRSKGRVYNGKTAEQWAALYRVDLEKLVKDGETEKDKRFDPAWNINEGTRQLAEEHAFFLAKTKDEYYAKIFAAAAYNAGRTAVLHKTIHIPVNKQTEYYTPGVLQLYHALVKGNGRLLWEDCWLLKL